MSVCYSKAERKEEAVTHVRTCGLGMDADTSFHARSPNNQERTARVQQELFFLWWRFVLCQYSAAELSVDIRFLHL